MRLSRGRWWRALLIVPPVLLGVVVFLYAVGTKSPSIQGEVQELVRHVRVIEVSRLDVVPVATGHGTVQPERRWNAVAEVAGRVEYFNPKLLDGAVVPAGTELLRIDPAAYELALAQLEAEGQELDVRGSNSQASLEIELRNKDLAAGDRDRLRRLRSQGTVSQRDLDAAEQTDLGVAQAVQSLESALALLPAQRAVLEARIAQARLDLGNTTIRAPFDMRVEDLAVERTQYVSRGQNLFEGASIERVEIPVQLSLNEIRPVLVSQEELSVFPGDLAEVVEIEPIVRLMAGPMTTEWPAEFVRISGIDASTRTVGVVVAVQDPYRGVRPGIRPPLVAGMFVEVELRGRVLQDRVVVPRTAIRGGEVLLVGTDSRLQRRAVSVAFNQGPISVIREGLAGGEQLVVTDLVPAIEGTLLETTPDPAVVLELEGAATGPVNPS